MSTELITAPDPAAPPFRSAALDLNIRQKSFVDKLIELKIGWKAAEAAGYSGDNATLRSTSSELLANPNVRAYYEERLAEMAVSSTEVLAELGEIARWDLRADERSPVRAADKLKALELAGKYHKLFVDRVETDTRGDPTHLASDLAAVLGVVREAIEAYRVATQAPVGPVVDQQAALSPVSMDQVGQASPARPIINITPTRGSKEREER